MVVAEPKVKIKKSVYYNIQTSNVSFKKMYKVLKDRGVKNNKFFLKVYDPAVIGVDPFDPNLDQVMQARILQECTRNVYYMLSECVRVKVSGNTVPFILHSGNLAMTWCYNNRLHYYVELPRQNYKTTSAMALILHAFNFAATNSEIMLLHQKGDGAKSNLQDIKDLRSELPEYLRYDSIMTAKGEPKLMDGNQTELRNEHNDNYIKAYASATNEKNADRIGRGASQPIQVMDEFAFVPHIETIYTAAAPAYLEVARQARLQGRPYGKMILSTPGDLDDRDGKYAKSFINLSAPFHEKLYDSRSMDEVRTYINENSKTDVLYIKFSYQQLGRGEDYFIEACRNLGGNKAKIRREILLEWASGNSASPFDEEVLDIISKMKNTPIRAENIMKYFNFNVYKDYNIMTPVLIGVDGAHGLDNDSSAVVVRHFNKKHVIATFRNPKISVTKFAKFLERLATDHFPNSIIAIERNGPGKEIIELLLDTPIADKLYKNQDVDDTVLKYDKEGYLDRDVARRKAYGVDTTSKSRGRMFDFLAENMREFPEDFVSDELISEILSLVKNTRGKIEAASGEHDDLVMAYNVGEYVFRLGQSLDSYGINTFDIDDLESTTLETMDSSNNLTEVLSSIISNANTYGYDEDPMLDQLRSLIDKGEPKTYYDGIYKQHDKEIALYKEAIAKGIDLEDVDVDMMANNDGFNNMMVSLNDHSDDLLDEDEGW